MTPALAQAFSLAEASGALVVRVDADSPAETAGLARGDVVVAFDGSRISHFTELLQRIAERRPGARSWMEVWRNGAKRVVWATLSEQAAARPVSPNHGAREWNDGLGLSLGELSPAQRRQLRIDGGLMVREAVGLARSEGIRAGDLIVALNDTRLERVDDFRSGLSRLPAGRTVALLVMRDRRLAYVPVRLPSQRADEPR